MGNFVLAEVKNRPTYTVGKIIEALQIFGSDSELRREPDLVLLSLYKTGEAIIPYYMPGLSEASEYVLSDFHVSVCDLRDCF